jgi:acetylornithine deacetylase
MDLIKYHHADAVIVTEPTDLELVLAHRGFIWYQVETIGRAVHGSRYQEGIDAIAHMGRFIAKLDRLASQLLDRPPHPLVGPPSLHAAKIKGGTDSCTYAARCTLHIDRRTIPGEDEPLVTQELWEIIDDLSQQDPNFQAKLKALVQRAPLETNSEAEIVEVLTQALSQEMGKIPIWSGAGYWSDAALLAEAGLDAVLLGPVGDGLHSTEEWVDVKSVFLLARVLAETARLFCGEEKDSPGGET